MNEEAYTWQVGHSCYNNQVYQNTENTIYLLDDAEKNEYRALDKSMGWRWRYATLVCQPGLHTNPGKIMIHSSARINQKYMKKNHTIYGIINS